MRPQDFVDVARRGIQIAALHVRVHVEDRANVQLRGHHRNRFAAEGRQIHQQLPGCRARRPTSPASSADPATSGCDRSGPEPPADSSRCCADPPRNSARSARSNWWRPARYWLPPVASRPSRSPARDPVNGQRRRIRHLEYMRVHDAGDARQGAARFADARANAAS